jgi:hypothetical protein
MRPAGDVNRTGRAGGIAMTISAVPSYSHTQKAPLGLLLYALALWFFAAAWLTTGLPLLPLLLGCVAVLLAVLGLSFHRLTVQDEGDRLAVRFGPLPVFRTGVRCEDIEGVELGRTTVLDCCGIHWSLRGGWVWSLWGWECVVVRRRQGVLRIGTDDAANLALFLDGKMPRSG